MIQVQSEKVLEMLWPLGLEMENWTVMALGLGNQHVSEP